MKSLNEIIAQFPEVGKVGEIIPLTAGLINQTYKVQTEDPQACDCRVRRRIFARNDRQVAGCILTPILYLCFQAQLFARRRKSWQRIPFAARRLAHALRRRDNPLIAFPCAAFNRRARNVKTLTFFAGDL